MKKLSILVLFVVMCLVPHITLGGLSDGLIGYWGFDDESAPVVDDSGNNHDGVMSGGVTWTADGVIGGALTFDGIDGYVSIPTAVGDFTDDIADSSLTFSCWVQVADNPDYYRRFVALYWADGTNDPDRIVLGKARSGWNLGKIYMQKKVNSGDRTDVLSVQTGAELPKNQWMHVVGVVDYAVGSIKLFIDGALDGTGSVVTGIDTLGTATLYFGTFFATNDFHKGLLDDVRIYSRALSDREVVVLYAADLGESMLDSVLDLELAKNMENSYLAHLRKLRTFIEEEKISAATNQLNALVGKIGQDIAHGLIDEDVGLDLSASATELILVLNGLL